MKHRSAIMIRFITRKLGFVLVFAFVSAVFLATCGHSEAQLKNGNDLPRPKPPLQVAQPPAPVVPGAFTGYVNGKVALVQYDNMQPGKKGGTFTTVGSLDLKSNLADVWNLNRTVIQQQIA